MILDGGEGKKLKNCCVFENIEHQQKIRGVEYIFRHGAADIHIPDPLESKCKMENWRQKSGYAKRRYEESRHLVGASQGGVLGNMEKLPCQGSSVGKYTGQNKLVGIKPWREMVVCAKNVKIENTGK